MPVVVIGTNLIYITIEIYMVMFIGIVKVIHSCKTLPEKSKMHPLLIKGMHLL